MLTSLFKFCSFLFFLTLITSQTVLAIDEYGVRCNPGGGWPREDGVVCLNFRPGTSIDDFDNSIKTRWEKHIFIAQNSRALALDCPKKAWNSPGQTLELFRRDASKQLQNYLTLKGIIRHGDHDCCVIQWASGGAPEKYCPDMAPLQI